MSFLIAIIGIAVAIILIIIIALIIAEESAPPPDMTWQPYHMDKENLEREVRSAVTSGKDLRPLNATLSEVRSDMAAEKSMDKMRCQNYMQFLIEKEMRKKHHSVTLPYFSFEAYEEYEWEDLYNLFNSCGYIVPISEWGVECDNTIRKAIREHGEIEVKWFETE